MYLVSKSCTCTIVIKNAILENHKLSFFSLLIRNVSFYVIQFWDYPFSNYDTLGICMIYYAFWMSFFKKIKK